MAVQLSLIVFYAPPQPSSPAFTLHLKKYQKELKPLRQRCYNTKKRGR